MVVKYEQLSRAEFERGRSEAPRRGGWKPAMWSTTVDGRPLLVKDVRSSNPIYRWLLGRLFMWHESNMYGYMRECDFVPRVVGWLDWDAFAIERVEATNLGMFRKPLLTPEFYDRLQACVDHMHAIGVVHLDLRSRRNILVTPDGKPMLIDFGNALYIGQSWLSRRVLVPLLAIVDNSAIVKFRRRDFPELLSRSEHTGYWAYRLSHVLWPWGRLWRAIGMNRAVRRAGKANKGAAGGAATSAKRAADTQLGEGEQAA